MGYGGGYEVLRRTTQGVETMKTANFIPRIDIQGIPQVKTLGPAERERMAERRRILALQADLLRRWDEIEREARN